MTVRRMILLLASAAALAVVLPGVAAGGVTGPAFYVDGRLYRTVGTPTDLSGTGAPAHSYDTIYDFGGLQRNVAEAAPGDVDYNGGRWQVRALWFADYAAAVAAADANGSGNFDSAEEVMVAIEAGLADDLGVVKQFECPAIPLPASYESPVMWARGPSLAHIGAGVGGRQAELRRRIATAPDGRSWSWPTEE